MEIKEILLVDARAPISAAIGFILQAQGYLVLLAPDVETAAAELNNHQVDLLLAYLTGHEEEKLDLLGQTKRRFPQIKVMAAGDPQKMSWQAFQEEVDDYLLVPFSPSELCRRVNRCLNQSKSINPESVLKGSGGTINEVLLNSLRLKFCDINNTLFSLIDHINILCHENDAILNNTNFIKFNEISDGLKNMMSITGDLLYNQLVSIDMNYPSGGESKSVSYGF